jgi:hypothetical protein
VVTAVTARRSDTARARWYLFRPKMVRASVIVRENVGRLGHAHPNILLRRPISSVLLPASSRSRSVARLILQPPAAHLKQTPFSSSQPTSKSTQKMPQKSFSPSKVRHYFRHRHHHLAKSPHHQPLLTFPRRSAPHRTPSRRLCRWCPPLRRQYSTPPQRQKVSRPFRMRPCRPGHSH